MKILLVRTYHLINIEDTMLDGYSVDEKFDLLISRKLNNDIEIDNTHMAIWNGQTQLVLNTEEMNCGKCVNCGGWTTDMEKDGYITELSYGANVDGKLLCDECLPRGHKWSFFEPQ